MRKMAYYSLDILDTLSVQENVIPELKKANGLEAVVSILVGKNFDSM